MRDTWVIPVLTTKNRIMKNMEKMTNEEKWSLFWILFIGIGGLVLLFLIN
jgi:hypothetical protein